jgi:uncharacterized protein YegJ (DUF2314 family)
MGTVTWLVAGIVLVVLLGALLWLWRRKQRITSLVLLLREAYQLDAEKVRNAAERAFGHEFALNDPQAEYGVLVTDKPGCFVVRNATHILGVINVAEPYLQNVGEAADQQRVFLLKRALQEHRAWLAVDWLQGVGPPSYGPIGKLLAELINESDLPLALYCPEKGEMNSYGPDLVEQLRSQDPLTALRQPCPDLTVAVEDDDAEMTAAQLEACERWPEFVQAFEKRKPMQGFAVKVPFREAKEQEWMWVEVTRIDGDQIQGKLANQPELIRHVKLGDEVTVPRADVADWIYSAGERMVGGFTSKVLEGRAPKR